MPSKKVLAERVKGNERLRRQQERWVREQRYEDRIDRAKKDEELNGVRLQLRDQAATFANKDTLAALERSFDSKLDTAIDRLNARGTEGFRIEESEREGREAATKEILGNVRANRESQATNRRWLITLAVTVLFSTISSFLALVALIVHLATTH